MQKFSKQGLRELLEQLPPSAEVTGNQDDESDASPVQGGNNSIIAWAFKYKRTPMKQLLKSELPENLETIKNNCFSIIDKYSEDYHLIDFKHWKRDRQTLLEALVFMEENTAFEKLKASKIFRGQVIAPLFLFVLIGCASKCNFTSEPAEHKKKQNALGASRKLKGQVFVDGVLAAKVKVYHRLGMQIGDDHGRFIVDTNATETTDSLILSFGELNRKVFLPTLANSITYNLSSKAVLLEKLAIR